MEILSALCREKCLLFFFKINLKLVKLPIEKNGIVVYDTCTSVFQNEQFAFGKRVNSHVRNTAICSGGY